MQWRTRNVHHGRVQAVQTNKQNVKSFKQGIVRWGGIIFTVNSSLPCNLVLPRTTGIYSLDMFALFYRWYTTANAAFSFTASLLAGTSFLPSFTFGWVILRETSMFVHANKQTKKSEEKVASTKTSDYKGNISLYYTSTSYGITAQYYRVVSLFSRFTAWGYLVTCVLQHSRTFGSKLKAQSSKACEHLFGISLAVTHTGASVRDQHNT